MKRPSGAFTLVEVMVAAAIFGLALLGIFGVGNFMHRTAIDNVADGIALHAAEGMMEQIRTMPYDEVLVPAANNVTGKTGLDFVRYEAATSSGAAASRKTQTITVNSGQWTAIQGINLATKVDTNFNVVSQQPMILSVQIILTPVSDVNFATGITVELLYRFQSDTRDTVSNRALRTFIPRYIK